jgi:exodeoxyribonuclease-5
MGGIEYPDDLRLSDEQSRAAGRALEALREGRGITIGGLAGSGKTTIIQALVRELGDDGDTAVLAPTGKAVARLRSKGVRQARTLHSFLYWAESTDKGLTFIPKPRTAIEARRIVVDEASMISLPVWRDLVALDLPTVYIGDHGQLEPIGQDPGLMKNPDVTLTEIHRQAAGNPIITFAHELRQGAVPERGRRGKCLMIGGREEFAESLNYVDAAIVGYNSARVWANHEMRRLRDYGGPVPQPGEPVVCLRNSYAHGLFNGQVTIVLSVSDTKDDGLRLTLVDDLGEEHPDVPADRRQFGKERMIEDAPPTVCLFDWGYALTAHKAQGSEWGRVAVFEQLHSDWNAARWRYTAATRAAEALVYCR